VGQIEAEKKAEKEARIQAKGKARLAKPVPKKKATVKPRAKKTATRPKKTIPIFEEPAEEVGSLEPTKLSFKGHTLKLLQRYKK
jgi:hypothetical protein